ncbi:hypothetical protein CFP56_016876, partial [Quercus suber]
KLSQGPGGESTAYQSKCQQCAKESHELPGAAEIVVIDLSKPGHQLALVVLLNLNSDIPIYFAVRHQISTYLIEDSSHFFVTAKAIIDYWRKPKESQTTECSKRYVSQATIFLFTTFHMNTCCSELLNIAIGWPNVSSEDREDGWHLHLHASPLRDGFPDLSHFLLVAALVFASDTMITNLGVGCRKLMSDSDSPVPFPPSQGFVLSCFLLVAALCCTAVHQQQPNEVLIIVAFDHFLLEALLQLLDLLFNFLEQIVYLLFATFNEFIRQHKLSCRFMTPHIHACIMNKILNGGFGAFILVHIGGVRHQVGPYLIEELSHFFITAKEVVEYPCFP